MFREETSEIERNKRKSHWKHRNELSSTEISKRRRMRRRRLSKPPYKIDSQAVIRSISNVPIGKE